MKKLVSLLLACCMLLSLSAAFAEEKTELTAFQYALENQNTDFNGLWFFDELEEHIDRNFIIANGAVNCGRFDVNGAGLDVFVGNWRRDVAPDLRALGVTDPVELAQDPREAFLYDSKALRRWLEELAGFSLKDVGLKADWQDANEPVSPHYSEGTR